MSDRARVLVVDDEDLVRELLSVQLRVLGHRCEAVGRASEAVSAAAESSPKLALVDLKLPDASGAELVRTLRRLDPDLPIVVISGGGDGDAVRECLEAGAAEFVQKPIELTGLQSIVDRHSVSAPTPPPAVTDAAAEDR